MQGGQAGTVLGIGTESARAKAVPGPLWAVIGTFAGSAVLTLLVAVVQGAGLFLLLPPMLIAVGLGLLAHRLYRGSRVARALAVVTAVGLLALAMGFATTAGWVLIALACVAAAGTLVLSPSARAFFTGPFGHTGSGPVSVALVRIVAGVLGSIAALIGLSMLVGGTVALGSSAASSGGSSATMLVGGLFGAFGGAMIALAVPTLGIAAFWFWTVRALGSGNRGARLAVSVVAGIDAFLLLISAAGSGSAGALLVGLVVHAAVVAPLWVPTDARLHFGDVPLPAVDEWHRKAIALVPATGTPVPRQSAPAAPPFSPPAAPWGPAPGAPSSFSSAAWGAPLSNARPMTPGPRSGPLPAPDTRRQAAPEDTVAAAPASDDPITAPIALGRHTRRDGQPA
ncbi:hypothetical protein [Actinomycetospora sp. NBRC 106378]|uniref:hypothetical protein n=1 Tax=Actinomycetospora sp. NBRC 106378 TaxID=3032208 RepID=UPI0025567E45|nr:hypothetical protein [Actinomycetospora sp. NBRC 106378]